MTIENMSVEEENALLKARLRVELTPWTGRQPKDFAILQWPLEKMPPAVDALNPGDLLLLATPRQIVRAEFRQWREDPRNGRCLDVWMHDRVASFAEQTIEVLYVRRRV